MSAPSLFSPQTFKRLIVGIVLEFGPIFIFLATFPHFRIYMATAFLMLATILSTVITYATQKRLPYLALYVTVITIIFGFMTIHHREPKFIQMRDTLYDITCALTLIVGLMLDIPFLKLAFNAVLPMAVRAWWRLTYLWTVFFLLSAGLNEYVRRNYDLHAWFHYKDYMVFVTMAFGLVALMYTYEHQKD